MSRVLGMGNTVPARAPEMKARVALTFTPHSIGLGAPNTRSVGRAIGPGAGLMLTRNVESYASLDEEPRYDPNVERDATSRGLFEFDRLWLLLRWRARLIAGVVLMTVLLAGSALMVLPASYRGTTIVLVDPRQPRVTNSEAVMTGIGADAAAVESQVEIIESSALARKVIDRLNLADDPDFASTSLL